MNIKRLMRDEKGQLLIGTLLLLLIGTLIIVPTLGLMGTGITSGRVYEQKDDEIYAADSGVEDAMWRIRNDTLNDTLSSTGYKEYDYSTSYSYPFNLFVNNKTVTVKIQNIWIPTGISAPTAQVAEQIIDDEKLIIIGYPDAAASTYDIKIVYYGSSDISVKTLGIWLSSGYGYVTGSSTFEKASGKLHSVPTVSLDKGGYAVVWSFTSYPSLKNDFTGGSSGNPTVKIFTFQYSGPQGQIPELVASWIDTTGVPGTTYHYSWDDSIRLYKIVSQAGGVGGIEIDAYGGKTKFRKLKSAISGDYLGTGNSLIGGMLNSPDNYHYLLYKSTSQTISTNDVDDTKGIPSDATIDAAYLYWTGWIDWNTYNPPNCGNQTRYPTGDYSHSGTWDKTTNMWSYVDETQQGGDGDTTFLLHGTTNGNALFSFSPFTVNVTGMAITGLTVSLVARDDTSGTNNMRPYIRVGGSTYYPSSGSDPSSSYGTISYTWATNPNNNNQPWTQDQINGVGSNALQDFGVYSSDASPAIRLTQVYATVGWASTLEYPDNPSQADLQVLVEQTARVNKVNFHVGSNPDTLVTADKWETLYPASQFSGTVYEGTWFYTCKADVTSLVKGWIGGNLTGIASNGAGAYTVGHVAATNQADPTYSFSFASGGGSTGYPLGTPAPSSNPNQRYTAAHAGWSLLILYSCASVYNHQYYLYDIGTPGFTFFFGWQSSTVDWDNDGNPGGTVSGFLVPPQSGDANAARITVMVGEGDKGYTGDYFKVNGVALADGVAGYGTNNVWNGNSINLPTDCGIDIDQFFVTWASGILKPMDVSALIEVPTGTDGFTMSYMLLQFRSELGVGGVITNYAIKIAG